MLQVLLSDADSLLQSSADAKAHAATGQAWLQQQPLKQYHEYLSFLFRRQDEPKPEQMLELNYRDYLQVSHLSDAGPKPSATTIESLPPPRCQCCHAFYVQNHAPMLHRSFLAGVP